MAESDVRRKDKLERTSESAAERQKDSFEREKARKEHTSMGSEGIHWDEKKRPRDRDRYTKKGN
jgi:hypothetical protein